MQEEIRHSKPPWHDQAALMNPEGPCPPCDTESFFGGHAIISPPETEPAFDPILEDPIYGDSPYFFNDSGDLVCMPTKIGEGDNITTFDTVGASWRHDIRYRRYTIQKQV